jgi:adenylate kinase family enzyme
MTNTSFNPELLARYGVVDISDFAYKMYEHKVAKEEEAVKEMAMALSDEEAQVVSDEITTILYWDALDEGISEWQIIADFYLDRSL